MASHHFEEQAGAACRHRPGVARAWRPTVRAALLPWRNQRGVRWAPILAEPRGAASLDSPTANARSNCCDLSRNRKPLSRTRSILPAASCTYSRLFRRHPNGWRLIHPKSCFASADQFCRASACSGNRMPDSTAVADDQHGQFQAAAYAQLPIEPGQVRMDHVRRNPQPPRHRRLFHVRRHAPRDLHLPWREAMRLREPQEGRLRHGVTRGTRAVRRAPLARRLALRGGRRTARSPPAWGNGFCPATVARRQGDGIPHAAGRCGSRRRQGATRHSATTRSGDGRNSIRSVCPWDTWRFSFDSHGSRNSPRLERQWRPASSHLNYRLPRRAVQAGVMRGTWCVFNWLTPTSFTSICTPPKSSQPLFRPSAAA